MFTGIIETIGKVNEVVAEPSMMTYVIESSLKGLKEGDSVAHNGICLTVFNCNENTYRITAVLETLKVAAVNWVEQTELNLERPMLANGRFDGHIVQGHVDSVGQIIDIQAEKGNYLVSIRFDPKYTDLIVEKGSICIDGVSLTIVNPSLDTFQVTIIPFTFEHTIFKHYLIGSRVNLEFDIIGKYILKKMNRS